MKKNSSNASSVAMLLTPIVSLCILTVGNGFFVTLSTIHLKSLHASNWLIGLVSAGYFAGFMVASYRSQQFIVRVGHIRTYAVFASLISVCSLIQGLTDNAIVWLLARYICGYCVAGLFIVIESWCLDSSSADMKGRVLSFYLCSYYLSLALGQLLLKIEYSSMLIPFCVISITAALSVLPVAMTHFEAPKLSPPESFSPKKYLRIIPLGVLGSFIAGLILGGIYTILPLAFQGFGFKVSDIAYLMSIAIFGGTFFQIPIGKLSDRLDRRLVLLYVSAFCCVISLVLALFHQQFLSTMVLVFLLGGGAFVIYPLCISHSIDYTKPTDTIAVLSTLALAYGVGSMSGPFMVANTMHFLGSNTIFYFFALSCLFLFGYSTWRIRIRKKAPDSSTANFVPAAQEIIIGAEQTMDRQLNK